MKNLNSLKSRLKEQIRMRIEYAQMDTRTYLWAKTNSSFNPYSTPAKGGGNFVIGLTSLVLFEYLAVTYSALSGSDHFYKDIDINNWKATKKSENLRNNVLEKLNCQKPRLHSVKNAATCVQSFHTELKNKNIVNLGLPDAHNESHEVWNSLRNGLAHVFSPKAGAGAGIHFHSFKTEGEAISFLSSSTKPAISQYETYWLIWGEILIIRDLPRIYLFLEGIIDGQSDATNLETALKVID